MRFALSLIMVLLTTAAVAQDRIDYSIDIGGGLKINQLREGGCVLVTADKRLVGSDYEGWVVQYAVTDTLVAVRTELDREVRYTVVSRSDFAATGPMNETEFQSRPEIQGVTLDWKAPERPYARMIYVGGILLVLIIVVGILVTVLQHAESNPEDFDGSTDFDGDFDFTDSSP